MDLSIARTLRRRNKAGKHVILAANKADNEDVDMDRLRRLMR